MHTARIACGEIGIVMIILSQKIDTESSYDDDLFKVYHFPARYKNQVRKGDRFIYYQGNRYKKDQRYYFGMGTIGGIHSVDDINYYAELVNCSKFQKIVPIYLPDGGYIEQLGYATVRKSINPPWQSSIRPISEEAYDYIVHQAGLRQDDMIINIENMNNNLKKAIQRYYIYHDRLAMKEIYIIAKQIYEVLEQEDGDA